MDPDHMMDDLRDAASGQIASNALALDQAPTTGGDDLYATSGADADPSGGGGSQGVAGAQQAAPAGTADQTSGYMDAGHAALDSIQTGLETVRKGLPAAQTGAEKAAKVVGGFAAKAPGRVLSGVDILTAKDKGRAAAGWAGGEVGGFVGGWVPGAELFTVPLGAYLGSEAGKYLYDHRTDIGRGLTTLQRGAAMFTHGFDQGLPPHTTPMN